MARDIIPAKLDVIFKRIFSTSENTDILRDLLSSLLDIPKEKILSINVLNSEVIPEIADGKFGRMDLKIKVDDKLINVEMQVNSQRDFRDRAVFYWAKLFSDELKSGENYSELKQTISINIINFNLLDVNEFPGFHSHYKLMETKRHDTLTDKCSIHIFELRKLGKKINKNNRMELWLQFLNAETEEELTMLEQTNVPEIQKAVMIVHKMSADERMRELARLREKALHDEVSALSGAREEGREEGRKEASAEKEAEMVAAMRENGISEEMIKNIVQSAKRTG